MEKRADDVADIEIATRLHSRSDFPLEGRARQQGRDPTNIPHPMVVPISLSSGNARYILITFEGTQYYIDLLGNGTPGTSS
jgi:hypothetical protein